MNFLNACLMAFSGKAPPDVDSPTISHSDFAIDPANATCGFQLLTTGTWAETGGSGGDAGTWLLDGAAADYDVRLTKNSGSDPGTGNLATWESLGSNRSWTWTQGSVGIKTFGGTLEIRRTSSGLVLDSSSVNITCTVDA